MLPVTGYIVFFPVCSFAPIGLSPRTEFPQHPKDAMQGRGDAF